MPPGFYAVFCTKTILKAGLSVLLIRHRMNLQNHHMSLRRLIQHLLQTIWVRQQDSLIRIQLLHSRHLGVKIERERREGHFGEESLQSSLKAWRHGGDIRIRKGDAKNREKGQNKIKMLEFLSFLNQIFHTKNFFQLVYYKFFVNFALFFLKPGLKYLYKSIVLQQSFQNLIFQSPLYEEKERRPSWQNARWPSRFVLTKSLIKILVNAYNFYNVIHNCNHIAHPRKNLNKAIVLNKASPFRGSFFAFRLFFRHYISFKSLKKYSYFRAKLS